NRPCEGSGLDWMQTTGTEGSQLGMSRLLPCGVFRTDVERSTLLRQAGVPLSYPAVAGRIASLVLVENGQAVLHCDHARDRPIHPDRNSGVGSIRCADRNVALARFAMESLDNKMFVREYFTALPWHSTSTTLSA